MKQCPTQRGVRTLANRCRRMGFFVVALVLTALTTSAFAQGGGNITGTVKDKSGNHHRCSRHDPQHGARHLYRHRRSLHHQSLSQGVAEFQLYRLPIPTHPNQQPNDDRRRADRRQHFARRGRGRRLRRAEEARHRRRCRTDIQQGYRRPHRLLPERVAFVAGSHPRPDGHLLRR